MELLLWRKLLRHLVKFLNADIDEINEQLTIDYESDAYMKLIERVSDLSEKFYAIEEVNYEAEVEKILIGLGFVRRLHKTNYRVFRMENAN
jgi:ATPase subunit of ABC transporter with duplicated ATPase domains